MSRMLLSCKDTHQVAQFFQAAAGIPLGQHLMFAGKRLDDVRTLASYQISSGCILEVELPHSGAKQTCSSPIHFLL
jgi:hypothetical protein